VSRNRLATYFISKSDGLTGYVSPSTLQ